MTIGYNGDDVVCCNADGCKKAFGTVHGWKSHYGQKHEKQTNTCVTCGEEFPSNKDFYRQCLECIKKHGRMWGGGVSAD